MPSLRTQAPATVTRYVSSVRISRTFDCICHNALWDAPWECIQRVEIFELQTPFRNAVNDKSDSNLYGS